MSNSEVSTGELNNIVKLIRGKQSLQAYGRLQSYLDKRPADPNALHLMGVTLWQLNRITEAISHVQRAIQRDANNPEFQKNLGVLLLQAGRLDESRQMLAAQFRKSPANAELCQYLAECSYEQEDPGFPDHVMSLIDSGKVEGEALGQLHFAAGAILDRQGEYHAAIAQIIQANACMVRDYNHAQQQGVISDLIFHYSPDYIARILDRQAMGLKPVFIVAMPRSGTTLLERLLHKHSAFTGLGELPDIHAIAVEIGNKLADKGGYPAAIQAMGDDMRQGFTRGFINRISEQLPGIHETRLIDKSPLNFHFVGLILDLFPDARILHIRRDPRDTCISCLFQNFSFNHNYSFNMENLARYYLLYDRIMQHWHSSVPPASLRAVSYEQLVAEPEAEMGAILDWLGEDREDGLLDFYRHEGIVRTASVSQVRKPINDRAVGRWQRYGDAIAPMLKILEPVIPTQSSTIDLTH